MKKDKVCISRGVGIFALVGIGLITCILASQALLSTQTSTNSRASVTRLPVTSPTSEPPLQVSPIPTPDPNKKWPSICDNNGVETWYGDANMPCAKYMDNAAAECPIKEIINNKGAIYVTDNTFNTNGQTRCMLWGNLDESKTAKLYSTRTSGNLFFKDIQSEPARVYNSQNRIVEQTIKRPPFEYCNHKVGINRPGAKCILGNETIVGGYNFQDNLPCPILVFSQDGSQAVSIELGQCGYKD